MWSILQQTNERESVLAIKLESKSKGNPSKNVWEGVRVERVSMRAHHPSLGLYLKEFGRCTRGRARHNGQVAVGEGGAQEPLVLGRPTCGVGRPQVCPLVPPFGQMLPQRLWTLEIWFTPKVCSKRCPKYFWYFWKGKGARKIPACRKHFWKFSNMQWGKTNAVQRKFEKTEKQIWDKYQFTFGKGASFKVWRARLFSIVLTIRRLVLENWTRPNSRPSTTPSFPSSFF